MYNMGTLLRHGSEAQKRKYLPKIATGELRLQSMGVTEPTTGTDTTKIKTTAVKKGDRYVVNGQKVWISRIQHSDLMILLARTTPLADVKKKSEGMSIFIVDLREAIGNGLTVRPILNMVNHETNELFFENLEIPAENLIGEEGQGFKYILDGLNAERTLIAAECIGDGYWFIDRVTAYTKERVVFGRPIGQNQGVQFPIAEAFIEVEAANLMRYEACRLLRRAPALRRAGQHGEVPGGQGQLGGGQRLPAVPRRLRLRLRIRHRAQVPRDAAVPGGADLDQPDPELRGRAHARPAPFVLKDFIAMNPVDHPSKVLATFAAELQFADIPAPVLRRTEDLMLDWLGSVLAARTGAAGAQPSSASPQMMGPADGPSEMLTSRRTSSPVFAALVNAAASHFVEQDDVHNGSVFHPAAVVIAPALAVAQSLGASGAQLLTAVVAGYEVGIRVGEFLGRSHYKTFHTTATAGTLAAAAAVGRLLEPHAAADAARLRLGRHAVGRRVGVPARRGRFQAAALRACGSERADVGLPRAGRLHRRARRSSKARRAWASACRATPTPAKPHRRPRHALDAGRDLLQIPRLLPPHPPRRRCAAAGDDARTG